MNDKPKWEFWIDRGGTFTDIVARSPAGIIHSHKLLSDKPEQYQDAVVEGLMHCLRTFGEKLTIDDISIIKMGTTVATNALLERKGEPVALAITQGFADALQIGYQNRPDLFALNIQLPSLLYDKVIEIGERVSSNGKILISLDEEIALKSLQEAFNQGYRAIAIILMHGYRYNQHEKILKKLAERVGFSQISVSHEVAPVMKLVSRGDTTVVDAYLSPVLNRYVNHLKNHLGKTPLFFMQSNGGLIPSHLFKGKDSIFSGPAGGVIGMIKTSQVAGFDKVIGFDMGGTSTDVAHFAGHYERCYDYRFSGVRIRAAMMMINTIAAGGGSILHFDGQRYIVGPDSAGANPGPACYRRDGPLTITDCNLKLGKIQANFFPKVFGKKGNQSLDAEIVSQKFQNLTQEINQVMLYQQTAEQIAEGYLMVAVENMANAIKKISIQRGYDVRQYILNCFGGAAGQHACLVADNLDIKTILIHPLAGVLSAYGMGLAEITVLKELAIERLLERGVIKLLRTQFASLKSLAFKELLWQKAKTKPQIKQQLHLRYPDSDTVLAIDFAKIKIMKNNFFSAHRQKFGFAPVKKPLMIEFITLELVIENENPKERIEETLQRSQDQIPYQDAIEVFTHGNYHQAFLYERKNLSPGDCLKGPVLICEEHATTFVEPGWQAKVTSKKHLLLTRYIPLIRKKISKKRVDPTLLEVFKNRFMNIAEQMGAVLRNTASSVNIKERLDFSCAIFDSQGELVANAPHIPVHLGSMSETVKAILKNGQKMHPQDAYVSNAPYHGGTHLPDITVVTPIFDEQGKNLLFLVGSRGHHADIGGLTPGSIPAASHNIEEEGVLINSVKLMARGRLLEKSILKLLENARYPARNPQKNLEDLKAQIAANACGVNALVALIQHFGLDVVKAYMGYVRDNACFAVQQLLTRLKNGQFCYSLDDGSEICVKITINKKAKKAKIDFTGSCTQHPGNFNAPTAITKAAVLYVLRCLVAEDIPLNHGSLIPIELIIPKNSILNPVYPAAVVAGNVETSQCIVDTLLGALGAVAASQGTCNNFTFGNKRYQYYETICGGAGAGPGFTGASAVHTHMTNTCLTDPEILECRFPVLLESFAIRSQSGGEGIYHGGCGVIRRIRFLEEMEANIISNHRTIAPYGLQGGKAGKTGFNWVERKTGEIIPLASCAAVHMGIGDVFIIETPGGGGFGKP